MCVSLYVSVSAPFHINKLTSINCLFALGNLQVFSFCVCVCISDSQNVQETFPVFRNKENNLTKLATTKYNFANENSIKFILNN